MIQVGVGRLRARRILVRHKEPPSGSGMARSIANLHIDNLRPISSRMERVSTARTCRQGIQIGSLDPMNLSIPIESPGVAVIAVLATLPPLLERSSAQQRRSRLWQYRQILLNAGNATNWTLEGESAPPIISIIGASV